MIKTNIKDQIIAVLDGKTPEKIPFVYFSDLIPQGEFERQLRNRGAGLIVNTSAVKTVLKQVEQSSTEKGGVRKEYFHTPYGDLSAAYLLGQRRIASSGTIQTEYLVKSREDYRAAIWIKDHTDFVLDEESLFLAEALLGQDGVTHAWSDEPPYMALQYDLGYVNWCLHQADYPDDFQELLNAHERMQERRLAILEKSSQRLINIGNLAGNFSPEQYAHHMLPYFERTAARLRACGKAVSIHADALNLAQYRRLLPGEGVNVVEAFTPPPVGNLSLAAARKAWGQETTIWINFPETVFYGGYEETFRYTTALLQEDPCPNKLLSFTEVGMLGVERAQLELFTRGIEAVMDAIDAHGRY